MNRTRFAAWCAASAVAAMGSYVTSASSASGTPALPDERRYELVSPGADKRGGRLEGPYINLQVAPHGSRLLYTVSSTFGDATHNMTIGKGAGYVAVRTAAGWRSSFVSDFPQPSGAIAANFSSTVVGGSTDLTRIFSLMSYGPSAPPGLVAGVWEDGVEIRPLLLAASPAGGSVSVRGASGDGSTTALETDNGQALIPTTGPIAPDASLLYERTNDSIRLVNAAPDGSVLHESGAKLAGYAFGAATSYRHAISDDGSRIYFVSRPSGATIDEPQQLFLRRDASATIQVSRNLIDPLVPAQDVTFVGASDDGRRVYFTSSTRLHPSAGATGPYLYRFDANGTDTGTLDVVGDDVIGTTEIGLPNVAVSDDGNRVYYTTDADGGTLVTYEASSRSTAVVASNVGFVRIAGWEISGFGNEAVLTPDGGFLSFASTSGFLDGASGTQIYRYDVAAGSIVRVTRPAPGGVDGGDSRFAADEHSNVDWKWSRNNISNDGAYVFFETAAPLVPADHNGERDVYRWSEDGPALVSSGAYPRPTYLVGAAADGTTVFFLTEEDLLAADGDDDFDVYAAVVRGGFADPVPSDCVGDACQAMPSTPPADETPGSMAFPGAGDAAPELRPRLSVKRVTKAQLRRLARGKRETLVVQVNVPGTVQARLWARVRGLTASVGGSSKAARRAETVRLPIRIAPAGLLSLRRSGRLVIRLDVTSAGVAGSVSHRLMLRANRERKGR